MILLISIIALASFQDDGQIVDTTPIDVPSRCATFKNLAPGTMKLTNNCSYPVYWNLQCRFGVTNCYGGTQFGVDAGESRTITRGINFVLDGPYRS